ncbi:pyrimidine reductase family protein [Nocardia sp. CDC159]|uniref:Pyrimidine reductase family protein n=1 Tax=Nocardia pulmonis TaxID=2951408 RepID=A0A9X2IWJ3_9NOCA|nr:MULTISPECIES: pyrimidine reductase family protein [Nocardia]MCM6774383.1 pyrimidine reductase family protein [Nocardia pulmonis]MCM6787551.1 pyrimidine reductase family protein [Nocardia sp. CDC159]
MQRVPNAIQFTTLAADDLVRLYAYPTRLESPWIRVNFVSSIDGAMTLDGRSGALGGPADKTVFGILRDLADVVLVGAGTVRTENYGGARTDSFRRIRLFHHGLGGAQDGAAPPIAVVTASAALDPAARLFTDTSRPPIVLTTAAAPAERKHALAAAGAEVLEVGETTVPAAGIRAALAERGLLRVLCEGGPSLFGELIVAEAVDELCLTVSPLLVGGTAGRIAVSPNALPTPMRLWHALLDDDGTVLTRWKRGHTQS